MSSRSSYMRKKGTLGSLVAWLAAGLPILTLAALVSGLAGSLVGGYLAFSRGLPDIPDLRAYRPKTVSTFYAQDGTVIGIFYHEKRFPIPVDSMPDRVVNAFLAAEDARFFSHTGVDWIGVMRAAVKNLQTGNFTQGGSTITQQVTRNFLLTKEKRVSRKIREAILAFRLEKTLTKKEILGLYLNEIYLGNGAYGVEAAARNYFGKTTSELTVAEAALLAGLIANPSKFSPFRNLKGALDRRNLILQNMVRYGFLSEKLCQQATTEAPKFRENLPNAYQRAPYFAEAVRKYVISKYGEDRLYNEGLQVWTTCDLTLQRQAAGALREGAKAWEKRHHRPAGLVKRLNRLESRSFLAAPGPEAYRVGDVVEAMVVSNDTPRAKRSRRKPESGPQECTFALEGGAKFKMGLASEFPFKPNDLVDFVVTQVKGNRLVLEPLRLPPVEGALVCIENHTGYVRALVGGLDFERSRFNRAVQAKRQPGSAFKPFVYTTALEWGLYGPRTLVVDEPVAVSIDPREPEWIPMNSDGAFLGSINLRQALAHSRNIAAVKLIMDVGIDETLRMARAMGIQSPLGSNLSLSLGASEVSPLELTSAYTVFPNMGVRLEPVLVKKVVDRFGNVLEDNSMEPLDVSLVVSEYSPPAPQLRQGPPFPGATVPQQMLPPQASARAGRHASEARHAVQNILASASASSDRPVRHRAPPQRVVRPQTAYLMASMLQDTCRFGTAATTTRMKRPDLAGKTGTTDDCTDAWFVGFNSAYTTGVWIGYDTKISLGRKEYGNVAALPVWMAFMKEAVKNSPPVPYPVPQGIVFWEENAQLPDGRVTKLPPEPDLQFSPELKAVCPVDAVSTPGYQQAESQPGQPLAVSAPVSGFFQGFSAWGDAGAQPGTVRILSPHGETLGHGYLTTDEKGKTVLIRDQLNPIASVQQNPYGPRTPFGSSVASPQQPPPPSDQQQEGSGDSDVPRREADGWRNWLPAAPRILQGWFR